MITVVGWRDGRNNARSIETRSERIRTPINNVLTEVIVLMSIYYVPSFRDIKKIEMKDKTTPAFL